MEKLKSFLLLIRNWISRVIFRKSQEPETDQVEDEINDEITQQIQANHDAEIIERISLLAGSAVRKHWTRAYLIDQLDKDNINLPEYQVWHEGAARFAEKTMRDFLLEKFDSYQAQLSKDV